MLLLVDEIEKKSTSATKKKQELRMLLNSQVKLQQKILGQDIHMKFSHSGKQCSLPEGTCSQILFSQKPSLSNYSYTFPTY